VKHFSFRRYSKDILFEIIGQAADHYDEYRGNTNNLVNKDNRRGLGHRELKRKTERALNQTFHPATFDKYLDILVNDGIFTNYKRHARGSKAEYCLTEKARKEFQAGVLQIHPIAPTIEVFADEEERRRLYHLLFTIETLEPPFLEEMYDIEEGMLERVNNLFGVSISSEDLVPQSIQRKEVDCTVTYYKPVSCIQLAKKVFSKGKPVAQLDADDDDATTIASSSPSPSTFSLADLQQQQQQQEQPAFYHIKTIRFSVTDVVNYERKFGFVSLHDLTKSKVKSGIRSLTKAKIIAPVGKLRDETRYAFADESLHHLVGSCLVIFNHTMQLLLSRVWQFERKVDREERTWLVRIYGKKQADRIISDNYDFLISWGQKSAVKDEESYNKEKKILYRFVKKEVEEIKQKYGGLVMQRRYSFPLDHIIDDMIFPQFLEKSLGIGKNKKSSLMASAHGRRR
jgi:hypothetical protein